MPASEWWYVVALVLQLSLIGVALADDASAQRPIGPMVGRVTPYSAQIWARLPSAEPDGSCKCRLLVENRDDRTLSRWNADSKPDSDWCVQWSVGGLRPATTYHYRIRRDGDLVFGGDALTFTTPDVDATENVTVKLAFGSCAELDAGSSAVFRQMANTKSDAVVLLGDTPYIDSLYMNVMRRKHRRFLDIDGLRELIRSRPVYAIWDDHDYGGSDLDGTFDGKEASRKVFTEYRAHPPYGQDGAGIYSSFRHGPVEVFLLDTRFFANIEKIPADRLPNRRAGGSGSNDGDPPRSLLGNQQWQWLTAKLIDSTAPVKLLACGTAWHDVAPDKSDGWGAYSEERDALFEFVGEQQIHGVVLVSGDLHQSRVIEHQTIPVVGYTIVEFVSSPIHDHTEPDANTPHPGLIKHIDEGNVFLQVEIDTGTDAGLVTGRFINKDGDVLHEEIVPIALLQMGD